MFKNLTALLIGLSLMAGIASAAVLNGAGATFPYPIYVKWNSVFAEKTGIKVNYQGIGSGGGIRQFTAGITDFGGSDAPMSDKEIAKAGGDILHIPTVMGAVAVVYNLPGSRTLNLDADTLADIFLGKIANWQQVSSSLPNMPIKVCYRSDGSGTTSIFTGYLAKVSLDWASKVGAGKAVAWPTGIGGKGNSGVAGSVKNIEGAIGYVELSYAITNNLPVAALKNKAGVFVKPSIESTSAAASGARRTGDFRLDLNNAPGKASYPIVGLTWLLVHKEPKDSGKGANLVAYIKWALTDGQEYAADLLYAPLPKDIAAKVLEQVDTIKI